jgi:hypothetical protein
MKQFKSMLQFKHPSEGWTKKAEVELESLHSKADEWIEQQYAKSDTFRVVSIVPSETVLNDQWALYVVWTVVVHYVSDQRPASFFFLVVCWILLLPSREWFEFVSTWFDSGRIEV